jgi:hypothetical protein
MSLQEDFNHRIAARERLQQLLQTEQSALRTSNEHRAQLASRLRNAFELRWPKLQVHASNVKGLPSFPSAPTTAAQTSAPVTDATETPRARTTRTSAPATFDHPLDAIAARLEDAVVRIIDGSTEADDVQDTMLVIDLRHGFIDLFVAAQQFGGPLTADPRFVQVDGGAAGVQNVSRTRLYAWRSGSQWKVCSEERFAEVRRDPAFVGAENIFDYLCTATYETAHDKLAFALVQRLLDDPAERVVIVTDDARHREWIRGFIERNTVRLDKNGATRWRDATHVTIDAELDVQPFACMADVEHPDGARARVLLFEDPSHAQMFDVVGDSCTRAPLGRNAFKEATHVVLVGNPSGAQPGVLTFPSVDDLRRAGLIGLLRSRMRASPASLAALERECAGIEQEIQQRSEQRRRFDNLNQRAEHILEQVETSGKVR